MSFMRRDNLSCILHGNLFGTFFQICFLIFKYVLLILSTIGSNELVCLFERLGCRIDKNF